MGKKTRGGSTPLAHLKLAHISGQRILFQLYFICFIILTNRIASTDGGRARLWSKRPGFDPRRMLLLFSWHSITDPVRFTSRRSPYASNSLPSDQTTPDLTPWGRSHMMDLLACSTLDLTQTWAQHNGLGQKFQNTPPRCLCRPNFLLFFILF